MQFLKTRYSHTTVLMLALVVVSGLVATGVLVFQQDRSSKMLDSWFACNTDADCALAPHPCCPGWTTIVANPSLVDSGSVACNPKPDACRTTAPPLPDNAPVGCRDNRCVLLNDRQPTALPSEALQGNQRCSQDSDCGNECYACREGSCQYLIGCHPDENTDDAGYEDWPVEQVCVPVCDLDGWCPDDTGNVVKDLGDGTLVYRRNGELFRGTKNRCRCLPEEADISTPGGERVVSRLQEGDLVWTQTAAGEKIKAPIVRTAKVAAPEGHFMITIFLADGRSVTASPEHPLSDGRVFAEVEVGDIIGNVELAEVKRQVYSNKYTYDILPGGETGYYWADGVLLQSTLAK